MITILQVSYVVIQYPSFGSLEANIMYVLYNYNHMLYWETNKKDVTSEIGQKIRESLAFSEKFKATLLSSIIHYKFLA